jgi:hypothetical protein
VERAETWSLATNGFDHDDLFGAARMPMIKEPSYIYPISSANLSTVVTGVT